MMMLKEFNITKYFYHKEIVETLSNSVWVNNLKSAKQTALEDYKSLDLIQIKDENGKNLFKGKYVK
jgi:hypothetical protein